MFDCPVGIFSELCLISLAGKSGVSGLVAIVHVAGVSNKSSVGGTVARLNRAARLICPTSLHFGKFFGTEGQFFCLTSFGRELHVNCRLIAGVSSALCIFAVAPKS